MNEDTQAEVYCDSCGEVVECEDDLRDGVCTTCRDSRHTNGEPVRDEGRD